jgi:hypothetical protein
MSASPKAWAACLLAEPVLKLAVGELEHPAVGVIDDHYLPGIA